MFDGNGGFRPWPFAISRDGDWQDRDTLYFKGKCCCMNIATSINIGSGLGIYHHVIAKLERFGLSKLHIAFHIK